MLVSEWLDAAGPLAEALPRFESRTEQHEMAAAVADAFTRPHHLAVEAGTGVGKTFAYLLPAIELITTAPARVVVSTHTIALQEQLIQRDIPTLQQALGVTFNAELVKGRTNYIGLRRLENASSKQKSLFNNKTQLAVLHQIEDWAYQTRDGSLSDLTETPPIDVWEKVRSEHGNCLGRRCPHYEPCFYQRARRRAEQAQLLVVNHALLMADLVLRRDKASVLPDYDYVVIDEAHVLEQVAADHLGASVANSTVQYLLSGLFNDRTGKGFLAMIGDQTQRDAVVSAARAASEFFKILQSWQQTQGRANGRIVRPDIVGNTLSPALQNMIETLSPLKKQLPREEDQYELQAALDRAHTIADQVDALITQAYDDHVYWIEADDPRSRRVSLHAAPLAAGPALREMLFDRVKSVVLTSATLATDGDDPFGYLLDRLGAPPAQTLQLGSPFDFATQATVHVEAGLPDPSDYRSFLPAAASAIIAYLRQTEGRAFVLFTSYRQLTDAVQIVRADLEPEGYTILAQGEDLPRSKMLDRLRETERCAIFGADSFWQGVDVPGDALRNVIIVKLPFAAPDKPTVEARIDQLRRDGRNPFNDFQIPEAVLKLRQGFGRLIRTRSDAGIVVLLDPRVVRKAYGKRFLASLPDDCRVEISKRPW